jgi:hypothetical protein
MIDIEDTIYQYLTDNPVMVAYLGDLLYKGDAYQGAILKALAKRVGGADLWVKAKALRIENYDALAQGIRETIEENYSDMRFNMVIA